MKKLHAYYFEYGRNHETRTNILITKQSLNPIIRIQNQGLKSLVTEVVLIQSYKDEDKVQYKSYQRPLNNNSIQSVPQPKKRKPYNVLVGLSSEIV
jgi:hypothetical protein